MTPIAPKQINVKLIHLPNISIDRQQVDELANVISSSTAPLKLTVKSVQLEDGSTVYQLYPPDTEQIALLAATKQISNGHDYYATCQIKSCKSIPTNFPPDNL